MRATGHRVERRERGNEDVARAGEIEYLIMLIAALARRFGISESAAYSYMRRHGAFALCVKHYGIMHTLPMEDNLATIQDYCRRKGGEL